MLCTGDAGYRTTLLLLLRCRARGPSDGGGERGSELLVVGEECRNSRFVRAASAA